MEAPRLLDPFACLGAQLVALERLGPGRPQHHELLIHFAEWFVVVPFHLNVQRNQEEVSHAGGLDYGFPSRI
ncbi:MAG TPA: hypothetical protein VMM36_04965, partial [Opitutaceae bacterium]|nr:hypothetical protein [Opitutaceae bacterium]